MSDEYLERYKRAWEKTRNEIMGGGSRWSPITCPEQYEKICKLCLLVQNIIRNQNSHSPEMVKLAFSLIQKTKVYMNVILRSDPKKVVVFECGKKILNQLMDVQMELPEADEKNFFFLKNGRNITVKKIKQKNGLPDYIVRFKQPSTFNPEVMKQAVDLERIESLVAENKISVVRAAQLEWGPNEMRILPNWRYGEKVELFFYSLKYHNGITKSEFDSIQGGKYNPFSQTLVPNEVEESGELDVPSDFTTGFGEPDSPSEEEGFDFGSEQVPNGSNPSEEELPWGDSTPEDTTVEPEDLAGPDLDKPSCFGNAADFSDDQECKDCPDNKECEALVASKTA